MLVPSNCGTPKGSVEEAAKRARKENAAIGTTSCGSDVTNDATVARPSCMKLEHGITYHYSFFACVLMTMMISMNIKKS